MDEVFLSPLSVVLVHLPLLVDIEKSQVVTFWNLEMLPGRVTLLLSVFGTEEDRGH